MENCIFCKLVAGEIPSYKVYEDDTFLAFLDIHPQSVGHVQIIPKVHYRWVWDIPQAGAYFELAQKIAKAQQKAFGTDWILSKTVGDEVHHAHLWVYPSTETKGDKNDFVGNMEKIKAALI